MLVGRRNILMGFNSFVPDKFHSTDRSGLGSTAHSSPLPPAQLSSHLPSLPVPLCCALSFHSLILLIFVCPGTLRLPLLYLTSAGDLPVTKASDTLFADLQYASLPLSSPPPSCLSSHLLCSPATQGSHLCSSPRSPPLLTFGHTYGSFSLSLQVPAQMSP